MSIIWTLRKYVDSIVHREEQAAQERDRKFAGLQGLSDGEDGQDGQKQPEAKETPQNNRYF